MQQHKKIFPLFFLLIVLISVIIFIPQVKATTTYEWIQNNSFEDGVGVINRISNAGFETGIFSPWVPNNAYLSTGSAHTGSYGCEIVQSGTITYTFSTPILGSSITEFSLWVCLSSAYHLGGQFNYNDSTSDAFDANGNDAGYIKRDVTSNINDVKYVSSFIIGAPHFLGFVDDIVCNVDYGGSGQTDFDSTTTPWFTANPSDFQGINIAEIAHTGIACVYDGYTDYWQSIIQNINFLDSNAVTNLTCYVSGASVPRDVKLKMNVIYSDRSFSTKTVTVTSNNEYDWKFMNFTDIILPNKVIIQIQFVLPEQTDYYVHVDDVSLLASIPSTQARFSYTLTPLPINQIGFTFTVYQKTNYIFNGFLYDSSGNPTENGTYVLITSKGSQSGNVISGVFSFVLTERLGVADFQESIIIQINSTLTIQLTAIWKFIGGEGEGGIGEGGYDTWYSNMVVTYMILFIFLIVPPLIIAFEFAKHDVDPFMGFIGGLCLTVPIAYMIHIIDLWVLFVFVLGLILMILSKLGAFSRV